MLEFSGLDDSSRSKRMLDSCSSTLTGDSIDDLPKHDSARLRARA